MIDMILYVPDFNAFAEYTAVNHPDMIARDADNEIIFPPEVTGIARTPAVINGNALMVYARVEATKANLWRSNPVVEVLAEVEYAGDGTALTLIEAVEADEEALAKYEGVYPRAEQVFEDEYGNERSCRPPRLFGTLMGAGGAPWPTTEDAQ